MIKNIHLGAYLSGEEIKAVIELELERPRMEYLLEIKDIRKS